MTTDLAIRKRELALERERLAWQGIGKVGETLLSNPVFMTIAGLVLIQRLENTHFLVKAPNTENTFYQYPYIDHTAGGVLQASLASATVISALSKSAESLAPLLKLIASVP